MVKRIGGLSPDGTLRLLSANLDYPYPPDAGRADDPHIAGKVLWKVTRA